jgi:hypothetical protein
MAGVDGLLPALVGRIDRLIAELSLARGLRIVTDIPPPLPTGPIVFFLWPPWAGAVSTALGYILQRAVWLDHDPVSMLLQLWY